MPNYTTKTGEVIDLTMHPSDIVQEFKLAAKKVQQIKILADQNLCTTLQITRVLSENGVDSRSIPKMYRTKLEREIAEEEPSAAKLQRNTAYEKSMGRARVSINLYDENGRLEQWLTIDALADEATRHRVMFLGLSLQIGLEDRVNKYADKRKEETA